jgi:hypothetical protein
MFGLHRANSDILAISCRDSLSQEISEQTRESRRRCALTTEQELPALGRLELRWSLDPLRALMVQIVERGSSLGAIATATSQRLWPASTLTIAVVGPDWSAWTARVLIKKNATTIGSRASKATTRRPRAVSRTGLEVWVLLERTAARCTGSAATAVT